MTERCVLQTSSPVHLKRFWTGQVPIGLLLVMASMAVGCSLTRDVTKTNRTATEQLLLTQAIERSLKNLSLPLPDGSTVALDTAGLTGEGDEAFAGKVLATHLNQQGFRVLSNAADATYRVQVIIQALGTEQGTSFVGMPQIQSMVIPFSLPEIALYKNIHQQGVVRWSLDVYEAKAGRHISSSPWYEAATFYSQRTVFLFFSSKSTDINLRGRQPLSEDLQ